MAAYHRLENLLEVEGKIFCNIKVPIIFEMCQVDLEKVKQQNISFEISIGHDMLFLKALIDTGSSDTLLGENLVGKVIRDKGVHASVSSILDNSRVYQAQQVRGYLKSGLVTVTIVKQLVKPPNNILLMNMVGSLLGIEEVNRERYNIDTDFLWKPIQLVVSVLDSQMKPICMKE